MDFEQNDNTQNNEFSAEVNTEGGGPMNPRLIKVKRPKRRPDEGENTPAVPPVISPEAPPAASTEIPPAVSPEAPKVNLNDFDLDDYLDKSMLPVAPSHHIDSGNTTPPEFVSIDEDNVRPNWMLYFIQQGLFTKQAIAVASCLAFVFGILVTKLFFSEQTVVSEGLQGVVSNPDVPRGRARCGLTERTQGCVLYIMNAQKQEVEARDFYELASNLTGRQRFIIETGNMRYANTKIRPGHFVMLNIPPLQ